MRALTMSRSHHLRVQCLGLSCALVLVTLTQPGVAQTINAGILDPTNTFAGKSYSEWAASFWQYYESVPATNNPFYRDPPYPVAPLSTGQSEPVWYLGGNYYPSGTYSYTNTVPGGVALFCMITDWEQDNGAVNGECPLTTYSEATLRAMAKSGEDDATNMTCTIDGSAVDGLTNVLTTPYRVQSPAFNYTCPAVHNVWYDVYGDTCFQNATVTPLNVSGAVSDGVFLMISPPSSGNHTINVTRTFPADSYDETYTYYLTVQPVALTIMATNGPGTLVLSWPQTPDNYSLETSSDLVPGNWQPANLFVALSNNTYQAATSLTTNQLFFRLKRN